VSSTDPRRPAWRLIRATLLVPSLLVGGPSSALDPGRPLSQAQVDAWQTENGLPQNTVTSILRTRDGHLWFGTYDGLVRFDGARFTVFDGRTTPLLATGSAFALMEDRRGALWIGRSENVLKYEDGVFRKVLGDELGQGTVWSLCEAPDGTVWGGAGKGLVRWKDGRATLLTKRDGLPAVRLRSVCLDKDGTLWIGTSGAGLVALRDGRVSTWSTENGFPSDQIITVLPDPAGGVWVATAGAGLVRIVGESRRVYGKADGLPTDQLTALALDAAGSLWIGTWGNGICRLREGVFSSLGSPPLSNDKVWSILPDREGFVWVGTWVGGLNRLRDRSFPAFGVPEGLSNDNVRAVLHGRDGSVWLATAGGGLNRLREGRIEVLRKTDGLPSDEVSSLCEDRSGALWVGTYTSGLARVRGRRIDAFAKAEGLPGLDVRVILEDRHGTIWVATTSGVATSRDGRRFEPLVTPDGILLNAVVCLLEDRRGALWFGTSGDGLVRYDAAGFKELTTRDGLVSDRVAALHEDAEGSLWIGSAWSGLNRLKDGVLTAIRPEDGLAEGRAQVILEDRLGGLWLTGNKGFQRLLKRELIAASAGHPGSIHPLAFGLADGLRSASFASGQQPAGSIGPDGRIWLPSYRGVVVVDPGRIPPPPHPPGVRLEEVIIDGAPRVAREGLEIGPGRQMVEIRYAATTLQPPELIHFRFRLDGFDKDWVEVDTRRSAYYTGLPQGRYRFRVASRIGDGSWGEEARALSLKVLPAFHQTVWFRVLAFFLVVSAAVLVMRRRTVQLRRRQARLERLVAERTEELRRVNERLSELSFSDALSGLANRRRFDEMLETEWKRGIRFRHPLSLVMADIDHFKRYNDALGHPAGDRCLVEVAEVLQTVARRAGDLVARYGGEEFMLLLPATGAADAAIVAETVRAEIEALRIPHPDGPFPFVTASFGVATSVPATAGDHARLVSAADAALYRAKSAGRNRVESAAPEGAGSPTGDRAGEPSAGIPIP
jgi:diguanylate cyclase (GGDEF)-like protein